MMKINKKIENISLDNDNKVFSCNKCSESDPCILVVGYTTNKPSRCPFKLSDESIVEWKLE